MSSKERTRRYRERLAMPEVIEEDQTMEILRRNGYAVDTAGMIEPYRRHPSDALVSWDRGMPSRALRYGHTHLGVIRIDTGESSQRAALIAAVVAAVDEPACLVGTSKASVVLVFRIGDSYEFQTRQGSGIPTQGAHEFVLDAKPGLFTATADAQPLDVAAYVWLNERSPLNTPHYALPPMHADISQSAFDAVGVFLRQNGGRFGPLALPETPLERIMREQAARGPVAEITPEEADERLVAANPNLRPTDGVQGLLVDAARKRIEGRKEAKTAEKKQQATTAAKAKMKELQALAGNPT
jgi:hypothetical protein